MPDCNDCLYMSLNGCPCNMDINSSACLELFTNVNYCSKEKCKICNRQRECQKYGYIKYHKENVKDKINNFISLWKK